MRRLTIPLLLVFGLAGTVFARAETTPMRGDVNGDGSVTAADVLSILSFIVGKPLPEGHVAAVGDNNDDGQITAIDALIGLSYTVGKNVAQFPIGKPFESIASVSVDPPTSFVLVGQTVRFTAQAKDAAGKTLNGKTFTWSSADETMATVDDSGRVTVKKLGLVAITATLGKFSARAQIEGDSLRPTTITAGTDHSCALGVTGKAYCWGKNGSGQLGDGTGTDQFTPVAVSGGRTYTSIDAGSYRTFAISTTGQMYGWGAFYLGNGVYNGSFVPVSVPSASQWVQVATGARHTVALNSAGDVYVWGLESSGSMGDGGGDADRSTPGPISAGGKKFKAVAAGIDFAIALDTSGAAWGWGLNDYGQLGNGEGGSGYAYSGTPVKVIGDLKFKSVTAGSRHVVALTEDGKAYAWGWGAKPVAGASAALSNAPVAVEGGLTFRAVSAGGQHTVGLTTTGVAYAWGANGNTFTLGQGDAYGEAWTPQRVAGGKAFRQVAAGNVHTVAMTHGSALYAWGGNAEGQLGDGTQVNRSVPVPVGGVMQGVGFTLNGVSTVNVRAGSLGFATYQVARNGGYTGDIAVSVHNVPMGVTATVSPDTLRGSDTFVTVAFSVAPGTAAGTMPVQVRARATGLIEQEAPVALTVRTELLSVGAVAAGGGHSCGLTIKGEAWCWGSNSQGQAGVGIDPAGPDAEFYRESYVSAVPVAGGRAFAQITAGIAHTCALTEAGTAYCWGANYSGQLGDGTTTNRWAPTPVMGGLKFRTISAGSEHTVGLTTDGVAYAWGTGALGDGTHSQSLQPTRVQGNVVFADIDAGYAHTLALDVSGRVWAWGLGAEGHAPEGAGGSLVPSATFSQTTLNDTSAAYKLRFTAISAGKGRNLAVGADGYVYEWGGSSIIRDSSEVWTYSWAKPQRVTQDVKFLAVSSGGGANLGLGEDSTVYSWGTYTFEPNCTIDQVMNGQCPTIAPVYSKWPSSRGKAQFISNGDNHAVILDENGVMAAFGSNGAGQLGNGTRNYSKTFTAQEIGFRLEPLPALVLEPGKSATVDVKIERRGGFTNTGAGYGGTVQLTFTGPTGVTGTFNPATLSGSATMSKLTITAASNAPPGTSDGLVGGTDGSSTQQSNLSIEKPAPWPADGVLNLVCPATLPLGYRCLTHQGVTAPFTYRYSRLSTNVGANEWWVESTYEVCVQWDTSNGRARARYKGGLTGSAQTTGWGYWGVIVKKNGDPDYTEQNRLVFTEVLDDQTKGLTYNELQGRFNGFNFVKSSSCPW